MTDRESFELIVARYRDGGAESLSPEDRARLVRILADEEGRRMALASEFPEIVFLAGESFAEPAWESYWNGFETRMGYHVRQQARQSANWVRAAAMAAVLVVIVGVTFVLFAPAVNAPATPGTISRTFTLEHVRPADVLPKIRDLLGEDATINVNETGLTIEDSADRLDLVARSLEELDRRPLVYALDVRLLRPMTALAAATQRVDGMPARSFDFDDYETVQRFALSPTDGRQLRETVGERWEIACYLQRSAAGGATLVSFSIYDRKKREITVRTTALDLIPGTVRTLDTGLTTPDGSPLIVSITLDTAE